MATKTKLTKAALDTLEIPFSQVQNGKGTYVIVPIEGMPGCGVKVTDRGVKTFVYRYRDKAGKPRRFTVGQYPTLTAENAKKAFQQTAAKVALGEDPAAERDEARQAGTIADLMDAYLDGHVKVDCARGTVRSVERSIVWIGKCWGRLSVVEVEDTHIRAKLALIPKGARNNAVAYLRAAWTWGRLNRVIPKTLANPAEGIEKVPSVSRRRDVTDQQYARIGAVIEDLLQDSKNDPSRLLAIKWVALYGARPCEAMRLRPEDVDLERGVVTLAEHKTARRTGKVKVFPLTPETRKILDEAAALRKVRKTEEWLFPRRQEQWEHNWFASAWRTIRERAKVGDLSLTNFRSAFITVAHDELGLTLDHVAGMTQHADKRTIENNYLVTRGSSVRANLTRMHDLLASKLRGGVPHPEPTEPTVIPFRKAG